VPVNWVDTKCKDCKQEVTEAPKPFTRSAFDLVLYRTPPK